MRPSRDSHRTALRISLVACRRLVGIFFFVCTLLEASDECYRTAAQDLFGCLSLVGSLWLLSVPYLRPRVTIQTLSRAPPHHSVERLPLNFERLPSILTL
eukprot:Lithocolla_globosa_v1_NODE_23_length_9337_cov_35.312756.p5 type:complete len:100 gc:universal NODE_23_length_9337_cov_35.312756:2630-2929(+)